MSIRKVVAEKLSAEARRRGLVDRDLAKRSGLSTSVVTQYMKANRELSLSEIKAICDFFGINLLSFLSRDYITPNIRFRLKKNSYESQVQNIENAIQYIKEFLPTSADIDLERPRDVYRDRSFLLAMAGKSSNEVKSLFGDSVEDIYRAINLRIIPVDTASFEAFLFSAGEKSAVCCGIKDKSETRLNFSLAHELSHYIFDRGVDVEIDTYKSMYSDTIDPGIEHEFYATKFAQFFLIPFENAERWAVMWPNINWEEVTEAMTKGRASAQVVANAIYDLLDIKGKRKGETVSHIANVVQLNARGGMSTRIRDFIEWNRNQIRELVCQHSSDFSEENYLFIKETLDLRD